MWGNCILAIKKVPEIRQTGNQSREVKMLCFMSYSQHNTDTIDLSSDLSWPLWLVEFSQIVFNPSIQNKKEYLFVPFSTDIRRSNRKGHRTRYLTLPKTRQSSQDWSKTQKTARLKTQARLIWTECLRPGTFFVILSMPLQSMIHKAAHRGDVYTLLGGAVCQILFSLKGLLPHVPGNSTLLLWICL